MQGRWGVGGGLADFDFGFLSDDEGLHLLDLLPKSLNFSGLLMFMAIVQCQLSRQHGWCNLQQTMIIGLHLGIDAQRWSV